MKYSSSRLNKNMALRKVFLFGKGSASADEVPMSDRRRSRDQFYVYGFNELLTPGYYCERPVGF
jgi:hypothetical protein